MIGREESVTRKKILERRKNEKEKREKKFVLSYTGLKLISDNEIL